MTAAQQVSVIQNEVIAYTSSQESKAFDELFLPTFRKGAEDKKTAQAIC